MPRFAANLSMMFTEYEFLDRFQAAANAGFEAVEFLFPYDWPKEELARRLEENNLQQVLFNLPPGDWEAGERGMACLPGREQEFRQSIDMALTYAHALNCPRLHCMAGLKPENTDYDQASECYKDNVTYAAGRCAKDGIELLIEPINPFDMPGFFLNDFAVAEQLIRDILATGQPAPGLQFDIYHCARIHGDVPAWLKQTCDLIAHFQIAGTPERHEPDRGNLDLEAILAEISNLSLDFWIGCEYRPAGRTEDGLGWIKQVR